VADSVLPARSQGELPGDLSLTPRATAGVSAVLFGAGYEMFRTKAGGCCSSHGARADQLLWFCVQCGNVNTEAQPRQVSKAAPADSPPGEEERPAALLALQPLPSPLPKAFPGVFWNEKSFSVRSFVL